VLNQQPYLSVGNSGGLRLGCEPIIENFHYLGWDELIRLTECAAATVYQNILYCSLYWATQFQKLKTNQGQNRWPKVVGRMVLWSELYGIFIIEHIHTLTITIRTSIMKF